MIGLVGLPLITDAAGLYHIYYAVQNREDAVHMIVHCISTARNNLVFGAVFGSLSSLVFHQQFLVSGAFVFSLMSFTIITTVVLSLRPRETAMNSAVGLVMLLIGFVLVTLTMPDDPSTWLALLSQGQGHGQQHANTTAVSTEHAGFTSTAPGVDKTSSLLDDILTSANSSDIADDNATTTTVTTTAVRSITATDYSTSLWVPGPKTTSDDTIATTVPQSSSTMLPLEPRDAGSDQLTTPDITTRTTSVGTMSSTIAGSSRTVTSSEVIGEALETSVTFGVKMTGNKFLASIVSKTHSAMSTTANSNDDMAKTATATGTTVSTDVA